MERYRQWKTELIEAASHFANGLSDQILWKNKEGIDKELEMTKSSIQKLRSMFEWNRRKEFVSSGKILKRNPGVSSKEYAEALKEVQEMDKTK